MARNGNGIAKRTGNEEEEEARYYTARHLLNALKELDEAFLDLPLILIHGKDLQKPNLVQGLIPAPTAVNRVAVESKQPSLLTLGQLIDELPLPSQGTAE